MEIRQVVGSPAVQPKTLVAGKAAETTVAAPTDQVNLGKDAAPTGASATTAPPPTEKAAEIAAAISTNLLGPAAAPAQQAIAAAQTAPTLQSLLPDKPFFITKDRASELKQKLNMNDQQLLQALVPVARAFARPPISEYLVGAAGMGKSGNIYLGVNLEFPGEALNQTVHGEQCVTANAMAHGETQLDMLAISAAPCGHCRQFLNELNGSSELQILTPGHPPRRLPELLPDNFGPGDLGVTSALLAPRDNGFRVVTDRQPNDDAELLKSGLDAANKGYAPYSNDPSGVAIRMKDGTIYKGSYAENAAFNPSLSPLQAALVNVVADNKKYEDIQDVCLMELAQPKASQQDATTELLNHIAPQAKLTVRHTVETLPGFDNIALVHVGPDQVATPEARNKIADQMVGLLGRYPTLKSSIAMVPQKDGNTGVIVASRPDAVAASRPEGVFELEERLASSATLKREAAAHPVPFAPTQAFDAAGKTREIRLPGNQSVDLFVQELKEGLQPNQMDQLKAMVDGLPKGKRVALPIGGPSAAGKSSLIKKIKEFAGDRKVVVFPGDNYFRDADDPALPKTKAGGPYWDDPQAMHFDEMAGDIVKLVKDGHADIPEYDFSIPRPGGYGARTGKIIPTDMGADDILVIDSIHATNPAVVNNLSGMDLPHASVYLDSVISEDRLVRRLVRDFEERGRAPELTLKDWQESTFPGEVNFVRPTLNELDPAEDVFLITKFPADMQLSKADIEHKVAAQRDYGLEPTYNAFHLKDEELPAFARSEGQRFQGILDSKTATEAEKKHAAAALDRLRKAPQSVLN